MIRQWVQGLEPIAHSMQVDTNTCTGAEKKGPAGTQSKDSRVLLVGDVKARQQYYKTPTFGLHAQGGENNIKGGKQVSAITI